MYDISEMHTMASAAREIGIRRESLYVSWIKKGRIKVIQVRDKPYIHTSEIERVKALRKEAGKC